MTQARAPTPHEVAAKSPVNVHLPQAVREKLLSTASAPARVTHRGGGQIRYETFRTVHAAGIALREEFRRPPTSPAMHFAKTTYHELQKNCDVGDAEMYVCTRIYTQRGTHTHSLSLSLMYIHTRTHTHRNV